MKYKHLGSIAVMAALSLIGSAAQAVTNLGTLGSSWTYFGSSFSAGTSSFTDYYSFSLAGDSSVSGKTFEIDIGKWFNVDLSSVTLSGGSLSSALSDTTPSSLSFAGLTAGSYTMEVVGTVTGLFGGSYLGEIRAVAAPVPEPADFALMSLGLAGVGWMVRRRSVARG